MKKLFVMALTLITLLALSVTLVGCGGLNLDAPENVKFDGSTNVLTWNNVEGADQYIIQINEEEPKTIKSNRYPYAANNTVFTVTIKGDSKTEKVKSAEETTITFSPLGKISEVRVDENGTLSWDPVSGATGYKLSLSGVEQNGDIVETTYSQIPVGNHKVQIRPVVVGSNEYYSIWSDAINMNMLGQVAVDSITYSNTLGKISWGYVSGAESYLVKVNGEIKSQGSTGTSIVYDANNQNFEVVVQAIGNGEDVFSGAESEVKKFKFLAPVTNLIVNDEGNLTWDAVPHATGYKIKINGSEQSDELTECAYTKIVAGESKEYQVMATSNDSAYFADWSAPKSITLLHAPVLQWDAQVDHLTDTPKRSIYWQAVDGAGGYTSRVTFPNGQVSVTDSLPETQLFFEHNYIDAGEYKIEIRANAPTGSGSVFSSKYGAPIYVKRLDAPTQADANFIVSKSDDVQQGFTVTFNSVAGATEYQLYKGDTELTKQTSTSFHVGNVVEENVMETRSFKYSIRSIGHVGRLNGNSGPIYVALSSRDKLEFEITVLAQPTTPYMDGFLYKYGEINGANGYAIAVGGSSRTSTNTECDLSFLSAGSHEVRVCAKGNGSDILASNYSGVTNVVRLEAPYDIRIGNSGESEGVLTYKGDPNAKSYDVIFNNSSTAIPAEDIDNMNQYITTSNTIVHMYSIANSYDTVNQNIYYMTSQASVAMTFIRLAAPVFGARPATHDQLLWNAPDNVNASTTDITYLVYNERGEIYTGGNDGTAMDISSLEGGKSYTFQVKAIGNGTTCINSELSSPVTIYKLATPEVKRENGKYTWYGVPDAESYIVYVDGQVAQTMYTDKSSNVTTLYEFKPNFEEIKEYNIKVVAVGNGAAGDTTKTIDSDYYEVTQVTAQLPTPTFTAGYTHESYDRQGKITVTVDNAIPNASCYKFIIAGVEVVGEDASQLTGSHNPNTVGKHTVGVKACGGTFDSEYVYWLDSRIAGNNDSNYVWLLGAPNQSGINKSTDGKLTWDTISGANGGYELQFEINGAAYGQVYKVDTPSLYLSTTLGVEVYKNLTSLKVRIRAVGRASNVITSEWVEKTLI
ncbi:MAG: hypothetical protein IKA11_01580 [Clostridia bacterium]|nr:hypothetical protein [Clostridia bacterium]